MGPRIAVLDYGIGNLRSAEKALQRVGAEARLEADPDAAAGADGLVIAGVGAFGPCMRALLNTGFAGLATDAITRDVPFMGICVGLQVLFEGSDEAPGTGGLGILGGKVRPIPEGVKSPQMQWNRLQPASSGSGGSGVGGDGSRGAGPRMFSGVASEPWVYFVHSYAPEMGPHVVATCDYGGEVVAACERGRLWGTQFHPEKSGSVGLAVLRNFVALCEGRW